MHFAIAFAVLVVAAVPVQAAPGSMTGWYLAMVRPDGTPTINNSPFGSETDCRRQLSSMRSMKPDLLGACVDLEPPH